MDLKIRNSKDKEGVLICTAIRPSEVVSIIKELGRAGGVHVGGSDKPNADLRYRFVLGPHSFYAEIVVHDEPQA